MNIIINGPGRSGTTLLSKLISYHEDLAWISGWVNRYPNYTGLSRFNNLYRQQIFNVDFSKVNKMPKPDEAYGFWNYYMQNFSNNYKPTSNEIIKTKNALENLIKVQGKKHFVTKITGGLRTSVLDKIFKEYKTIWIERDPRVVVSSYMKQRWFYKDKETEFNNLSMEDKIRFYSKYYLKIFEGSKTAPKKVIFYEDLCEDPVAFFKDLLSHLDLEFTQWHKSKIEQQTIVKVNWSSYKEKYKDNEIVLLHNLLNEPLREYNYL